MPVTYDDILKGLRELGVTNGSVLAVHSSLKSIGTVDGDGETVVEALKSAVGRRGTLLMPAFTEPADVFHVRDAPSTTGRVTEVLRLSDGSVRSLHPTHSVVAWGRFARHLTRDHHRHQALGLNSPFHRLLRHGGKVLFIGVDLTKASIVHVAESIARAPYQDIFYPGYQRKTVLVAANGRRCTYRPLNNPGDPAGLQALHEPLMKADRIAAGSLGKAAALFAGAADIVNCALELLAKDGAALLCRNGKCPVCPERRRKVKETNWRYSG